MASATSNPRTSAEPPEPSCFPAPAVAEAVEGAVLTSVPAAVVTEPSVVVVEGDAKPVSVVRSEGGGSLRLGIEVALLSAPLELKAALQSCSKSGVAVSFFFGRRTGRADSPTDPRRLPRSPNSCRREPCSRLRPAGKRTCRSPLCRPRLSRTAPAIGRPSESASELSVSQKRSHLHGGDPRRTLAGALAVRGHSDGSVRAKRSEAGESSEVLPLDEFAAPLDVREGGADALHTGEQLSSSESESLKTGELSEVRSILPASETASSLGIARAESDETSMLSECETKAKTEACWKS